MRSSFVALLLISVVCTPVAAQDVDRSPVNPGQQQDEAEAPARAQTNALIEAGRRRQNAANARTTRLWTRWVYAVCIGCLIGEPRVIRIVHTSPVRVLAGIPAADDDAREQVMTSRIRHSRAASAKHHATFEDRRLARRIEL